VVDVTALASAEPRLWAEASADWQALGVDLGGVGEQLNSDVAEMISGDYWTGAAATKARQRVTKMVDSFQAAQGEVSAVSSVLEGLAEAMTICRQTLAEAQELASRHGMTVGGDGTVTGGLIPPEFRGAATAPLQERVMAQVQELVDQALRRATEVDRMAAKELRKLARDTGQTNPGAAYGNIPYPAGDGLTASRDELQMIYDSIPSGPPSLVAQWWAGLTLAEQKMLMGAAAGKLGTLKGIPASVQAELRGSNGINRVALVNYALDNAFNGSIDIKGIDNCTNFVSHALAAAGMIQEGELDAPNNRADSNVWYDNPSPLPQSIGGQHWYTQLYGDLTRSRSWDGAPNLYQFLTQNGSQQVPYSQAQPGDIAFYANNQGIYHSAVVTAVVNGQVFYSQHTPGMQNASWANRQYVPATANPDNPTRIIIVQPGLDYAARPTPTPTPEPPLPPVMP
jgi:hypothetical protein